MDERKRQVREHFTVFQLTLLSIVVALILENLLSHLAADNPINFTTLDGWTIPLVAATLQFSLGLWCWLGALLLHLGVLGAVGGLVILSVAAVAQLSGVVGTLHGWISSTR